VSGRWQAAGVVTFSALARRGDAALRDSASRLARRTGWTPTVLAHPGYGSGGRVRVLGRVLLAPARSHPEDRRAVPGWQRFLTLESPGSEVVVEVAGQRTVVRSDDDGLVDVTLEVDLPDAGALPVRLSAGSRSASAVVHLASPGAARGVVCDIDDTVLVTGIATPLRAAWRTFVQPMTSRQAVPGMVRLLRDLTSGAPHVPVVYLSNGPWNLAGPLARFLERSGFPPGALLLTDWGPTPTRWFRDGRAHKRAALQRLAVDLPGVRWTLVGDTGEHDPALYEEFARARPDRVRAVLLRDTTGGATRQGQLGEVPVVYGRDGDEMATALPPEVAGGPPPADAAALPASDRGRTHLP
jgi:phosphatidate phosphatase APP1